MNKRLTEEQAKKTYDRAIKLEQEFGEYFTGKLPFPWYYERGDKPSDVWYRQHSRSSKISLLRVPSIYLMHFLSATPI